MKCDAISKNLDTLYSVTDGIEHLYIDSGMSLDGVGTVLIFTIEEGRYMKLSCDRNFMEWFDGALEFYDEYIGSINAICARFGVTFDESQGCVYLRFRRNEMSITAAVTKMHGALQLLASLQWYLYS